jgi:hypothetical protein
VSSPPVPTGYDSWNQYIEDNAPALAAAQSLSLQEAKASIKLLDVSTPGRTDTGSPDYMIYNVFTTWAARTVSPEIGRPWRQ